MVVIPLAAWSTPAQAVTASSTPTTVIVSTTPTGSSADFESFQPVVSHDGRYVAFNSAATDLVDYDTNRMSDVFVRDLVTGVTTRVSVTGSGQEANDDSYNPSISGDGRYVAFLSFASNLSVDDKNAMGDVYVRDLVAHTTTLVSVGLHGSAGNGPSDEPAISTDGSVIAFTSQAPDLVTGDTNATSDVFVRNLQSRAISRVSVATDGSQGNEASREPSVSADGSAVAFVSRSTNLSAEDNSSGAANIFVRNRATATTTLSSVATSGRAGAGFNSEPALSGDGRYVAFTSSGTDLVDPPASNGRSDIFRRDLDLGVTVQVSTGFGGGAADGFSDAPSISDDGRYVAFESMADNLILGSQAFDSDIFVRDLDTFATVLISADLSGRGSNGSSTTPSISGDGLSVAFRSTATDLSGGQSADQHPELFLRSPISYPLDQPPVANAGPDQTVRSDQRITLDGSRSRDPEGGPLDYEWTQVQGPPVALLDDHEAVASAGPVATDRPLHLTFRLRVTDSHGDMDSNEVTVTVNPK